MWLSINGWNGLAPSMLPSVTPSAWAWRRGALWEQIAAWIYRGLKLIKELSLAFISLYLPAIYMLMWALPLRVRRCQLQAY